MKSKSIALPQNHSWNSCFSMKFQLPFTIRSRRLLSSGISASLRGLGSEVFVCPKNPKNCFLMSLPLRFPYLSSGRLVGQSCRTLWSGGAVASEGDSEHHALGNGLRRCSTCVQQSPQDLGCLSVPTDLHLILQDGRQCSKGPPRKFSPSCGQCVAQRCATAII